MFYWFNRFNNLEHGDMLDTIDAAKAAAVDLYKRIQNGFAFDIIIVDSRTNATVAEGHIKGGKWIDGEFSETREERIARLGYDDGKRANT